MGSKIWKLYSELLGENGGKCFKLYEEKMVSIAWGTVFGCESSKEDNDGEFVFERLDGCMTGKRPNLLT